MLPIGKAYLYATRSFSSFDLVQLVHFEFQLVQLLVVELDFSDDSQPLLASVHNTEQQIPVPVVERNVFESCKCALVSARNP